jgi:uncharacterized protein
MSRLEARLPAIVDESLRAYVREMRRTFSDRIIQIRLFGSYARGEANEESDVDVLVLIEGCSRDDEIFVTNLAADLVWQLHGVVISPLVMSLVEFEAWKESERRAALEIAKEGILL